MPWIRVPAEPFDGGEMPAHLDGGTGFATSSHKSPTTSAFIVFVDGDRVAIDSILSNPDAMELSETQAVNAILQRDDVAGGASAESFGASITTP